MDFNSGTHHVDVSQLCRLCAVQDEHHVPIFEGHGLDLEFEVKLEKYLSLKVSKDDVLPLYLCLKCSNILMSWHEFFIGCKETEERLISLLCEYEERSDFEDEVFLDEDSQDSVKIIESDTSEIQPVSQPNYDSGKFNFLTDVGAKNATIQDHQSNSPDGGRAGTLFLSTDKRQDSCNVRFPGQLVFGKAQPTSPGTVHSLKSQRKQNAVTTLPNSGQVATNQSPLNSTRNSSKSSLKSQESNVAGNVNKAQPNAAQTKQIQSVTTPPIKNPAQDKGVILSGKKATTIVKSFILSRPDNSTAVAKPSTSAPGPDTDASTPSTNASLLENLQSQKDGGLASGEAEPVFAVSLDDHRYSKSAKAFEDSDTKQKNRDRTSLRKSIIKAQERRVKFRGCFVCGKIIHNKNLRFTHERSHFKIVDILSYNCTFCGESFKTFDEMVLHRKKHRLENAAKNRMERQAAARNEAEENAGTEINEEDKNSLGVPNEKNIKEIPATFKCAVCGIFFYNRGDLDDHKESHIEEERKNPYPCPTCGKRFATKHSIRRHVKTHVESPGELCSHCGKVFRFRSNLNKHRRKRHSVPKPWPKLLCEFCPKVFDSRSNLLAHLNCHTGERPFKCDKCDKAFHSPSNLNQHAVSHTDARPCMCHICGKTFKMLKSLRLHSETHDSVECQLCGKKLNGLGSLNSHKYRFHRDVFFMENPNIQKQPCHLCNRVLSSNVNLDLHLKRFHADGKRFSCDVCGKRFTTKVRRNDHLRLHTGEKPYACNLCDKTFSCASYLNTHKFAHSEVRHHQCQYCDKQFKRKTHLECHQRSHTGEKPYVCEICNRGFAHKRDMHKHRSIHVVDILFQCSSCGSTFKKKKEFLRHLSKPCVSDGSRDIDSAILPS